jgi:regulator of RNase E activity RraA
VVDFGCPIEIGGVQILPGDLIIGDLDGVIVVPQKVEEEVIAKAVEKATAEKVVRKAIEAGMSSTDAFHKFGIL